jgi:hypothetical protein
MILRVLTDLPKATLIDDYRCEEAPYRQQEWKEIWATKLKDEKHLIAGYKY